MSHSDHHSSLDPESILEQQLRTDAVRLRCPAGNAPTDQLLATHGRRQRRQAIVRAATATTVVLALLATLVSQRPQWNDPAPHVMPTMAHRDLPGHPTLQQQTVSLEVPSFAVDGPLAESSWSERVPSARKVFHQPYLAGSSRSEGFVVPVAIRQVTSGDAASLAATDQKANATQRSPGTGQVASTDDDPKAVEARGRDANSSTVALEQLSPLEQHAIRRWLSNDSYALATEPF